MSKQDEWELNLLHSIDHDLNKHGNCGRHDNREDAANDLSQYEAMELVQQAIDELAKHIFDPGKLQVELDIEQADFDGGGRIKVTISYDDQVVSSSTTSLPEPASTPSNSNWC